MDFGDYRVDELAAMVRRREVSARELTTVALARIEAVDPVLHAFVSVDADSAFAEADAVDGRLAAGGDVGPLAGIPLAVKDLEDARGYRTTAGSRTRATATPATEDSSLVARLRAAGCVVVGKTNTPEFGLKPTTDNRLHGVTGNPWSAAHTCGGSSGGSAAAVAAGMVPLATASDGGGSIRIPSAVCGLPGLKPTTGQVPSADRSPPGWPNLSTRGVLGRRTADVALALESVRGFHALDLRSVAADATSWVDALSVTPDVRRVGWSPTLGFAEVDAEVRSLCTALVDRLAGAGVEVVEVNHVFSEDPGRTIATLVGAYTLRTVEPFRDTAAWLDLDPAVVMTAEITRLTVTAVDVVGAIDGCHRLNHQLVTAMEGLDLLLCPTTCGQTPLADMRMPVSQLLGLIRASPDILGDIPPAVGEELLDMLGGFDEINLPAGSIDGVPTLDWTRMTQAFNMTGSPAGTAVAGWTQQGLPVGLQVVGRRHSDLVVLQTLQVLEDLAPTRPRAV